MTRVMTCDSVRDMNIEVAHHTTGYSVVHRVGCYAGVAHACVTVQPLGERKSVLGVVEEYRRNGADAHDLQWHYCVHDLPEKGMSDEDAFRLMYRGYNGMVTEDEARMEFEAWLEGRA